MKKRFAIVVGVLFLLAGAASGVMAQSQTESFTGRAPANPVPSDATETYGTLSMTYVNVGSWDFDPVDSTITYDQFCCTAYGKFRTGGSELWFHAPLNIPNGALIQELQLQACDTSATADVVLFLLTQPNLGDLTETFTTQTTATPGCTTITTIVMPAVVVDNAANYYGLEVAFTGIGNTTRLVGARVGYRLQVSPAPATASFTDVPVGHPLHRFVEALASSGVTGGCGGGNYCPDSPITRGQMAVFLSSALGLHFPN